jgi:ABC-type transport system involved in multi-copper enzyme maturation permease subunit
VFATQAGVALVVSAFARRRGLAAVFYIAFTIISNLIVTPLADSVSRWFAVLDLQAHTVVLIGKIFNDPEIGEGTGLVEQGISPWVSLLAVVVIAAAAAGLLYRRYQRLM